jgi:hypothetical protein
MNGVTMNPLFTLVRDSHYVAVVKNGNRESVAFGRWLPLSKRAAMQYVQSTGRIGDHRVIMRKTAKRAGLL